MPKARIIPGENGNPPTVVFYCPACRNNHAVPYVNKRPHPANKPVWFFDENQESPTIEPSLRTFMDESRTRCHVVVTRGVLNYCGDCPNEFANKQVPMVECKLIGED